MRKSLRWLMVSEVCGYSPWSCWFQAPGEGKCPGCRSIRRRKRLTSWQTQEAERKCNPLPPGGQYLVKFSQPTKLEPLVENQVVISNSVYNRGTLKKEEVVTHFPATQESQLLVKGKWLTTMNLFDLVTERWYITWRMLACFVKIHCTGLRNSQ